MRRNKRAKRKFIPVVSSFHFLLLIIIKTSWPSCILLLVRTSTAMLLLVIVLTTIPSPPIVITGLISMPHPVILFTVLILHPLEFLFPSSVLHLLPIAPLIIPPVNEVWVQHYLNWPFPLKFWKEQKLFEGLWEIEQEIQLWITTHIILEEWYTPWDICSLWWWIRALQTWCNGLQGSANE